VLTFSTTIQVVNTIRFPILFSTHPFNIVWIRIKTSMKLFPCCPYMNLLINNNIDRE